MVRLSKPRLSDEEVYAQRLAEADDATRKLMTESLVGKLHFRKLTRPTVERHERCKALWRKFVKQHERKDSLPMEIIEGKVTELPDSDIIKEFVRFLGNTVQGRLDRYAVKKTIEGYIFIFFALWRQYGHIPVPKDYRIRVMEYFNSAAFDATSKLCTKKREKPTATLVDLEVLIRGILDDKKYFRTHRARSEVIYAALIAALSSERPGAIVEFNCYRGSNEALVWGDHDFWVIPNPEDAFRPFFALVVHANLLKGHREDDGFSKYFFIIMEPENYRHVCALMYVLVLAFKDQIFRDVSTPEEIFFPKNPCTVAHRLTIKETVLQQPTIRREVHKNQKWTTSETLAMPYYMAAEYLRKISLFLGFIVWFTFYCFRRCSANNMNAALPEDERRRMMGQNPNSNQFFESYQARLAVIDLGSILAERTETSAENTAAMKTIYGMSKGRDPNAPISLDISEINDLLADPELVEFREEKQKLVDRIKTEEVKLCELEDDAANAQASLIQDLRAQVRILETKHNVIVSRETRMQVAAKRKAYFEDTSRRQLQGTKPVQRVPLAAIQNVARKSTPAVASSSTAPGAENVDPDAPIAALSSRVTRAATIDPMDDVRELIYNFTLENSGAKHLVACINAFLALPERPAPLCYPGESPNAEGRCPVSSCNIECSIAKVNHGGKNAASHIHGCVMGQLREDVQAQLEADYTPRTCGWAKCKRADRLWSSRAAFCGHIGDHVETFQLSVTLFEGGKQQTHPACRWKDDDGEECGARDCDDLEAHIATAHGVNVVEKVSMEYCAICAETFVDFDGDGGVWRDHCVEHYDALFSPFDTRVETDVNFDQHGVLFTAAVDNCVEFENGEGFGGERPEFHGHIEQQVPLAPAFCPLCVYDKELPMDVRMKQFHRNQEFQLHLSRHEREIWNKDEDRPCSVPSCGLQTFDAQDMLRHLVVYHRVPICGATSHIRFRRLRLPEEPEARAEDPQDEAPVEGRAPPSKKPRLSSTAEADPPAPDSKIFKYHCAGCGKDYKLISLHFRGLRKANSKCQRRRFQERDDDGKLGPEIAYATWIGNPDYNPTL
ncbi:hypothetical protein MVEN_02193900 [Mycena venus]|uniref:Uncharacterized protein n=1 Tax=Mycena venus TaxID=2733690 RepID=A0A8H7CGE7_9AGAR|nr:hypothetical protein MVEN_02193900 [Mycena venus]